MTGTKLKAPNIGEKFNEWTIIDNTIIRPWKGGETAVMCQCSCGNKYPIRLYGLYSGRATKCKPCAQQERGERESITSGSLSLTQYNRFKKSAVARNIDWQLSMEYLWQLFQTQNGKCALSGIELVLKPYTMRSKVYIPITASIDRIDSNDGYREGNVQWVHKDINNMKQSFSQEYFIDMCKKVATTAIALNIDSDL